MGGGRYATKFAKVEIVGDEGPFDPSPLIRIAPDIILWGGNHFADKLPPSPSWLVWDKRAASGHSNDFADCELAWSARKGVARVFRHHWDGMMKASERGIERVHPTQKPIALMVWCMEKIASEAQIILDPFMGSGTTGIAAVQLGRKFIGVEIERHYFDVACRRIQNALDQPNIFIERPKADAPKQETFL